MVRTTTGSQDAIVTPGLQGSGLTLPGSGLSLSGGGCGCGQCAQCGSGLIDSIRASVGALKRIKNLATGDIGTAIRNALPDSDENARPGFPGENHAILKLPNGKFGVANYMGPGTQLVKRLKRGDPGRTMSDTVSMAHDSRYGLAKSQKDVASADRKMISKLKDMQKKRQDSKFNIQLGMKPIQAKMHAERLGLVKPGTIASFGDIAPGDRALVSGNLSKLEQEGFGAPGSKLRTRLLNQQRVSKSLSGRGDLSSIIKQLTSLLVDKALPALIAKMSKGSGLRLAGQRGLGVRQLKSDLHMKMLRVVNNGASRSRSLPGTSTHVVGSGLISGNKLKSMAMEATKTMLPVMIKMVLGKLGLKQTGSGFVNIEGRTVFKPSTMQRLAKPLNDALLKVLKKGLNALTGKSQVGRGFFDDFAKGFMKVWSPILKIAKVAAPLIPLLL